jgi:GntR family transcriptional regulator
MQVSSNIVFRLNPQSGLAPYRQIVEQVRTAIADGRLRPGDKLPPVREVVSQVTINPNTVQRAYRELEHLGLTQSQWGQGSFVATNAFDIASSQNALVELGLQRFIEAVRDAGMSTSDTLALVAERLSALEIRQ